MKLIQGDCLQEMQNIESGSVDLILTDLPYGTTACSWDEIIPFEPMWKMFYRILRPNGFIVLTASQPFTTKLIASNIDSQVLSAIFAVIALLVAIKMALPLDGIIICKDIPQGMVGKVPPLMIGSLSAMIGIGGGTLSVPVLTLMSQPIHRAVVRVPCGPKLLV